MLLHAFGPLVTKVSVCEIKRQRVETLLSNHAQVKKKQGLKGKARLSLKARKLNHPPPGSRTPRCFSKQKRQKMLKT